jgi:hypothetical protein
MSDIVRTLTSHLNISGHLVIPTYDWDESVMSLLLSPLLVAPPTSVEPMGEPTGAFSSCMLSLSIKLLMYIAFGVTGSTGSPEVALSEDSSGQIPAELPLLVSLGAHLPASNVPPILHNPPFPKRPSHSRFNSPPTLLQGDQTLTLTSHDFIIA